MISRETLALVESGWRGVPVLVVGDVMLDQYVWGEVERISPEAPVPIVRAGMRDERPGGAANVAMNLGQLGACVTLVGFAGCDPEQDRLVALLAEQGIEPHLTAISNAPTTTKLRILSGHQQIMRLDTECGAAHSSSAYASLLQDALRGLPDMAIVVLSDYAKGAITEEVPDDPLRNDAPQHPGAGRSQAAGFRSLQWRNRHLSQPEGIGSRNRRAARRPPCSAEGRAEARAQVRTGVHHGNPWR